MTQKQRTPAARLKLSPSHEHVRGVTAIPGEKFHHDAKIYSPATEACAKGRHAMTLGNEIHAAIARRDTRTLREMARVAHHQEAQMFLALLADIIDRRGKHGVQPEKESAASRSSQVAGQLKVA
jgi:hypothetical protein